MNRTTESGAASVEYVVVTLILVAVLFLPVAGKSGSVVDVLLDALRGFQAHSVYLTSMP